MPTSYPNVESMSIADTEREFSASYTQFATLIDGVKALPATATHSDIERYLDHNGRELLRIILQDRLNRSTAAESSEPPAGMDPDEVVRRTTGRDLRTVFGDVELRRVTWKAPETEGRRPLDAQLNMPDGLYSHRVAEFLGWEVAHTSFGVGIQSLLARGIKVPMRQAEELAADFSEHFDAFYRQNIAVPAPSERALLVMSADGKGIAMHKEDLRPETKKRASKRDASDGPLGSEQKNDKKRMAEVAAIWWQEPVPRTPEDIVGEVGGSKPTNPPRLLAPVGKRVWASVTNPTKTVISDLFDEAERRDPQHRHTWVAAVDGNEDQRQAFKREAKRRGVTVLIVLDVVHVIEYLWDAGSAIFGTEGDGPQDTRKWVGHHLHDILRGASGAVASSLSNKATHAEKALQAAAAHKGGHPESEGDAHPAPPMSWSAVKELRKTARYLRNHRDMLRYDVVLRLGGPIASGVIEGACRHIVKDRMGITGARWRLRSAEAVLRLRALRSSGNWDAYIAFYERMEAANNHAWYAERAGISA